MKVLLPLTVLLSIVLSVMPPALSGQPINSVSRSQASLRDASLNLNAAEIAALVDECGKRTTSMMRRIFNYAYTEIATDYEVDRRGQVTGERSKVYEVYPIVIGGRSRIVRVQVSENSAPFSPEKIKRERERLVAEITKDEQNAAAQGSEGTAASITVRPYKPKFWSYGVVLQHRKLGGAYKDNYPVRPTDFLVWHEFFAPRATKLNGREAILLNFRPRPNYVYDRTNVFFTEGIENYGRVMAQLGGRVWIDAADKVIMRLEAVPVSEMNGVGIATSDGTNNASNDAPNNEVPLGFAFVRLPNGAWFPSRSWYNSYGRENLFWKTGMSRAVEYREYKLFTTSVEGIKLDTPPQ